MLLGLGAAQRGDSWGMAPSVPGQQLLPVPQPAPTGG